ncbi:MAG: lysostaphin resistance A-like protein [Roseburia sp.]
MEVQMLENKRRIRKEANRVGWGLILYTVITFFIVMSSFAVTAVYTIIQYPEATEQDAVYNQMVEKSMESGTSSIIGVCLGALFLLWFFRKKITMSSILDTNKKMQTKTFIQILCVFMGGQLFFLMVGNLLESGLNLIGYSAMESMESASSISTNVSMFLYASIVGPIVEEVVYRGFVLRSFQKFGKVAAVVLSSLLFGVMHGNIPQGMFAFGVGLILGYVTVEYSIVWSIVLHVVNNCIFGDVFGWLVSGLNEQMQTYISYGVWIAFALAGVFVIWKKRSVIKDFFLENRTGKRIYCYIFSAVGIILFIAGELFLGISMLQKL